MIIPILNGLLRFSQAPVTWLLFIVHGLIYFMGALPALQSQATIDDMLDDSQFMRVQGRIFSQYVASHPSEYSALMQRLASKAQKGDAEKLELMGTLAIRNSQFLAEGPELEFQGDQVQIARWKKRLKVLQNSQDRHPSYVLGLTADDMGLTKWMSYIFVHSGPYHFIGNMFFLLIFGSMLEPLIGGLALLVIYILTGMIGAGVFLLLTGATAAPLIGASGAVSGLMSLFCLIYWRTPVRFMYFVLPSAHYTGFIFLPAWIVLVMFAASDVAGYLSAVPDFGGVAYAAHLGGEAAALLAGFVLFLLRYRKPHRLASIDPEFPVGRPISIAEVIDSVRVRGPNH